MKILKLLLVSAALMGGLCGCSTVTSGITYEHAKLRVYTYNPRLACNLELVQDVGRRTPEGFLFIQLRVRNKNNDNLHCKYRVVWIDGAGMELPDNGSNVERPFVLQGCEEKALSATAPLTTAQDYRFEIRPNR